MSIEYEIFDDFNEYHELIPRVSISSDHIEVLINSAFSTNSEEEEDLVFCIIETVSIGNLKGIGTTQFRYIHKSDDYLNAFTNEYWHIIEQIQSEMPSLASFEGWYNRSNSYIIMGSNPSYKIPTDKIPPRWTKNEKKENPGDKGYITNASELTKKYIKDYLDRYVQLLSEREWFNSAPYFTIIIKPISFRDNTKGTFIPLGNFYLIFGTISDRKIPFYRNLVNKLLLVWQHNYGATVVREIEEQPNKINSTKLSDEYRPHFTNNKHLSKISGKDLKQSNNSSYDKWFRAVFDKDSPNDYSQLIEERFIRPENDVFFHLKEILEITNDKNSTEYEYSIQRQLSNISEKIQEFTQCSFDLSKAVNNHSATLFLNLLSTRRIILAYRLICGLNEGFLNKILIGGNRTPTSNSDSIRKSIWNKYFIPLQETNNYIYSTAAFRDKLFLEEVYKNLCQRYPDCVTHPNNFLKKVFS